MRELYITKFVTWRQIRVLYVAALGMCVLFLIVSWLRDGDSYTTYTSLGRCVLQVNQIRDFWGNYHTDSNIRYCR